MIRFSLIAKLQLFSLIAKVCLIITLNEFNYETLPLTNFKLGVPINNRKHGKENSPKVFIPNI